MKIKVSDITVENKLALIPGQAPKPFGFRDESRGIKPICCHHSLGNDFACWQIISLAMFDNKNVRLSACSPMKRMSSGFSLVETMVAIFLFSLVSVMLAGVFSSFLKSHVTAKKAQRSAESAQYTMNLMAKTIRTSAVYAVNPGGATQIQLYDNSSGNCVVYDYDAVAEKMQSSSTPGASMAACAWTSMTPSDMTSTGDIKAATFIGTATTGTDIGKITIAFNTVGNTPTTSSQVQTTVSLRETEVVMVSLPSDTTKPTITTFTVPVTSNSLTIAGITLAASDDTGVTGYLITESATAPAVGAIPTGSAPTSYTASSAGAKTLYAWAKDAAGNVSDVYTGRACTITLSCNFSFPFNFTCPFPITF